MYKLILVDDERSTREGLRRFLEKNSYPIQLAGIYENAGDALKAIPGDKPDLVVTDVVMPGMLGTDFARELRRLHPPVQIIMISGHQNIHFVKQGIKSDICDYLLKPIDLAELDQVLRKAMERCEKARSAAGARDDLVQLVGRPLEDLRPELRGVLEYINLHYREHITLQSLSEEVYLSPSYISAVFRKETGGTFSDFLTKFRVEKSKILLGDYRLKVVEVARQVGYDDPAYYGKVFRRHTGMNPIDYRRQGERA